MSPAGRLRSYRSSHTPPLQKDEEERAAAERGNDANGNIPVKKPVAGAVYKGVRKHQENRPGEGRGDHELAVIGAKKARHTCGQMRPTKPMGPAKQTAAAVMMLAEINDRLRRRERRTPRLVISSSEREAMFRALPESNAMLQPTPKTRKPTASGPRGRHR